MRIYKDFKEAMGEVQRDLVEMGIRIHPKTYQDKYVADDPNFDCFEVTNYIYTVTGPIATDLNPTQPWADAEFQERMSSTSSNPGEAWKLRAEVWSQFLLPKKNLLPARFAYTYGERLHFMDQFDSVLDALKEDPDSRQGYISIWRPEDTVNLGGISRVPCSLGYYFQIRRGSTGKKQLNMTYHQRSADFATHFQNDVYLAFLTQAYLATLLEVPVGNYVHWIGSLHIFAKDSKGVF